MRLWRDTYAIRTCTAFTASMALLHLKLPVPNKTIIVRLSDYGQIVKCQKGRGDDIHPFTYERVVVFYL